MSFNYFTTIVTNNPERLAIVKAAEAEFKSERIGIYEGMIAQNPDCDYTKKSLARVISGEDDYGLFKVEERNDYYICRLITNYFPAIYVELVEKFSELEDEEDHPDKHDFAVVVIDEEGQVRNELGNYKIAEAPSCWATVHI